MLALANIRKTKSATVTLVIMFLISALLLNAGLLVVVNYGSYFGELREELDASDAYFSVPDKIYTEEVKTYLNDNEHVENIEIMDGLVINADILSKGKEKSYPIMFTNMEDERDISKWKYVGEHLPAEEMSVYIPDIFKAVSGYELNDKIKLNYIDEATREEKNLTFTIKGYTEDVYFSSTDTGYISFYMPEETYNQVKDIINQPNALTHIIFTNVDDVKNVPKMGTRI